MERMAQHIMNRFGEDKIPGIPGHQEVEIGLMRMYHATGKEAYKDMARYFLEERGKNPNFFKEETERRGWTHFGNMIPDDTKYNQSHATIYEQDICTRRWQILRRRITMRSCLQRADGSGRI